MNLFDRFMHWLLPKFFEYRDIVIDGDLYLRRYFLKGRGTDRQWFLHNIRLPDAGRDLHDHPWDFKTWVLKGGYVELVDWIGIQRLREVHRWKPQTNPAEHTHRITSVVESTWTLVRAGRACRVWGFVDGRTGRWVPWRTYLGLSLDTPDHPEDALAPISISTKKFAEKP